MRDLNSKSLFFFLSRAGKPAESASNTNTKRRSIHTMRGRSAYLTHLGEEEEVVFLSPDGCYEKKEEEEEADFLPRIPFSLPFSQTISFGQLNSPVYNFGCGWGISAAENGEGPPLPDRGMRPTVTKRRKRKPSVSLPSLYCVHEIEPPREQGIPCLCS